MHHRLYPLIVILFLTGCDRKPPIPPAAKYQEQNDPPRVEVNDKKNDPPRAELRIGDDQDEARHLSFRIIAVHEKQNPTTEAPYRKAGGDWTFLDCQAISDPRVTFTVGVLSTSGDRKTPIAWGKALLVAKDREAGGRFVNLFSKAFGGKLPAQVKRDYVPEPLRINTAILGFNMARENQGGFSGEAGGWTATKWFPEFDGESGEVYFNYDLEKRVGEFSEKDAEYADPLVAIFATALRDGPRPERTPENDPNLTRIGPKIGQHRKLLSRRPGHFSFTPDGRFAVYQDGSTIFALPTNQPDSKPLEIVRFDQRPRAVHVLDNNLNLIVQDGIPEQSGVLSSVDPMRIWWVDGKSKEKKLLRGPEKELSLGEYPVSPDQRYVAFGKWQDGTGEEGRYEMLYILDRQSGESCSCKLKKSLSVIGWKQTQAGLRVVAVTNRWLFHKNETSDLYYADPATGNLEHQEKVDPRLEIDNPLSPDGNHRVRVGKEDLIVTDVPGGKQHHFVFHEQDRRYVGEECVKWVSPRYLRFNGPKLALIDVTTMKMNYPNHPEGKFGSYEFSSDFRWVMYQGENSDGEGLFLAPVEMPKDGGQ